MYDRFHPSPRYRELIALYRMLHREGDAEADLPAHATFDGRSLLPHAYTIKQLIDRHAARTILDYGAGKGRQYGRLRIVFDDGRVFGSLREVWGVDRIVCYDPGVADAEALPEGPFDGVVCTDVLEHCPEEDLAWIVDELFACARKFVFATVALYPARKTLPNGENAHCTLKPVEWWRTLVEGSAAAHPEVRYRFELHWTSPTTAEGRAAKPEILEAE